MERFPFVNTPDVFILTIPADTPRLSRMYFRTEWGESDEELCFFNGTLLGKVAPHSSTGDVQVILVPRLDSHRGYPWPRASDFAEALLASRAGVPNWNLWCELDADQRPVPVVVDAMLVRERIENVLAFCEGKFDFCPTFSTKPLASVQ